MCFRGKADFPTQECIQIPYTSRDIRSYPDKSGLCTDKTQTAPHSRPPIPPLPDHHHRRHLEDRIMSRRGRPGCVQTRQTRLRLDGVDIMVSGKVDTIMCKKKKGDLRLTCVSGEKTDDLRLDIAGPLCRDCVQCLDKVHPLRQDKEDCEDCVQCLDKVHPLRPPG